MNLPNEWDRYIAFLRKHQDAMNDWELGYVKRMWRRRQKKKGLSLPESFELRRIHHQIEFRVG